MPLILSLSKNMNAGYHVGADLQVGPLNNRRPMKANRARNIETDL
jgi:hypothetical protein